MNQRNVSFYYDEEFKCLVKVVDKEKETRMSLDTEELGELQWYLEQYLFTENEVGRLL